MSQRPTKAPYEPPKPLPVQLALQGGGAKICTLMAAMEAVEELEAENIIRVTRVAGTSAGSLVGCLFAAKVKMGEARAYLVGGEGKKLLRYFPEPSLWKMGRLYLYGQPIWDVTELKGRLTKLFEKKKIVELSHFLTQGRGIPVKVVAADLAISDKVVYPDDLRGKRKRVVDAIMDSCGLPFYMRAWGGGTVAVDGGICENLPSEVLKDGDQEQLGRVAAFIFPKAELKLPQNFKTFSLGLLEVAMNHSIARSMESLKEAQRFPIPTTIDTFDFKTALDVGLQDEYYNNMKDAARKFLKDFVEDTRRELIAQAEQKEREVAASIAVVEKEEPDVTTDYWTDAGKIGKEVMQKMFQVYRAQHEGSKFKYVRCLFEVKANCLRRDDDPQRKLPDSIFYQLTFEPFGVPLYCVSVALARSKGVETTFLGKTKLTVRDGAGLPVNTINVPALNPDPNYNDDRELLVFFDPPLKPESGRYTLTFQDAAHNFMGLLAMKVAGESDLEDDELSFVPRRAQGQVERIDLVLHIPDYLEGSIKPGAEEGAAQIGQLVSDTGDYKTDFDFHTIAWRGENLKPNVKFNVKYYIHGNGGR